MSTFTKQITSSQTIVIDSTDGVLALSVQAAPSGGAFNFLGTYVFKGIQPNNLELTDGQGVNLIAPSTAQPIDNVTIEWVSGTVEVLIFC